MENEVSGIAKLGIVLIALAVLIGLGFGIFQISKSTANTGVGNVQSELDGVSNSTFTTYDQTSITGTMATSAVSDFEGQSVAVLVATQAWTNFTAEGIKAAPKSFNELEDVKDGSGLSTAYIGEKKGGELTNKNGVPVVWAFSKKDGVANGKVDDLMLATTSEGKKVGLSFINYNAILGNGSADAAGVVAKGVIKCDFSSYPTTNGSAKTNTYHMAGIYFDSNCYRCTSGFATTDAGKVVFNNIASNLSKTGRVEFIPSGAKFSSFLVKDASGTNVGVAFQQVSGN